MDRQKQKGGVGSLHNPLLSSARTNAKSKSDAATPQQAKSGGLAKPPSTAGKLSNPLLSTSLTSSTLLSSRTSPGSTRNTLLSSSGTSTQPLLSSQIAARPKTTQRLSSLEGDKRSTALLSLSTGTKLKDKSGNDSTDGGVAMGRQLSHASTGGTGTPAFGVATPMDLESPQPQTASLANPLLHSSRLTSHGGSLSSRTQSSLSPAGLAGQITAGLQLSTPSTVTSRQGSHSSSHTGSHMLSSSLSSTVSSTSSAKRLRVDAAKHANSSKQSGDEHHRWESMPASEVIELPDYDFPVAAVSTERRGMKRKLFTVREQSSVSIESPLVHVGQLKATLINTVAGSLIRQPNFKNESDPTRHDLVAMTSSLVKYDAEFVLKLALYARCELNIRTTANFLLALSSNVILCRPYLRKYFCSSIRLPSDWIEVAELYMSFHDNSLNYGALPVALRRAMADKFPDFDEYQLAKYNKDKSKNKRKKVKKTKKGGQDEDGGRRGRGRGARGGRGRGRGRGRGYMVRSQYFGRPSESSDGDSSDGSGSDNSSGSESEFDEDVLVPETPLEERRLEAKQLVAQTFTLKQLIRKIHITKPVNFVMALLGKKYPNDLDSFYRTRLDGTWDPDMAGKRMKLKTPETWETQVSSRGNKAAVWEDLIAHNKLPFMAMLRNIRNMILSGMDPKSHDWVIKKLSNRNAVANSRQFPFRFLSAYEILDACLAEADKPVPVPNVKPGTKQSKSQQKRAMAKLTTRPIIPMGVMEPLVSRYRKALDEAVRLATKHNVAPIRGRTLVLVNGLMQGTCTSAKGLGKPREVIEVAYLLALMCHSACEFSRLHVFGLFEWNAAGSTEDIITDNLLESVSVLCNKFSSLNPYAEEVIFPIDMLMDYVYYEKQIDNILILSDGNECEADMQPFLARYRQVVNPNLLYVNVDLSGSKPDFSSNMSSHPNDIFISGFSDQVLRFIADRGSGAQLTHVEHIDVAYSLKAANQAAVVAAVTQSLKADPTASGGGSANKAEGMDTGEEEDMDTDDAAAAQPAQLWRTARVFLSSTFRDMHGERDLLTRYVFPELRARARGRRVNVFEVDLRWGVTEKESQSNKSLDVCLTEVSKCNFFVGLLGERYGWCPGTYHPPPGAEFDWIDEYPSGRSVTELEMQHAALIDPSGAQGKAFFHIRDPALVKDIPWGVRNDFASESENAWVRMTDLKSRVRRSGLEVAEYSCRWGGVADGKPMVVGLEAFGQRVLEQLWNAIKRTFPEEDEVDWFASERVLHAAFAEHRLIAHLPRTNLNKQAIAAVKKAQSGGLLLVQGDAGAGKSTLVSSVLSEITKTVPNIIVVAHYCGAAPGSTYLPHVLTRICREVQARCKLSGDIPEEPQELLAAFPKVLKDATAACQAGSRLLIAIDGVDVMDSAYQAQSLQWLPDPMPKGVIFMLTVVRNGKVASAVSGRSGLLDTILVSGLNMPEKMDVVRSSLALHRKKLDESPFNNQMKLLVTKKESTSPFYLNLACAELRVFGIFEKVNQYIKDMPSSIPQLLQGVLQRLESDHGETAMRHMMLLLASTRDGLLESEVQDLLTMCAVVIGDAPMQKVSRFAAKKEAARGCSVDKAAALAAQLVKEPSRLLPPSSVSHLLRSVQVLLQPTAQDSDSHLKLAHDEIHRAISQRYLHGVPADQETSVHSLMAGYYLSLADPGLDGSFSGHSTRALSELPYHLAASDSWSTLESTLCNLKFLQAKADAGLAFQLLQDFYPNGPPGASSSTRLRTFTAKFQSLDKVKAFQSFLSRNMHIILRSPALLWQQAVNEPHHSTISQMATQQGVAANIDVVVWANKPDVIDECAMTLPEFPHAVSCLAISANGKSFVCGGLDCSVKIFSLATGKEVQSFVGHGTPVVACCFVGRNRLCTASQDGNISLWDLDTGFRVSVMKEHKRRVGGLAGDPSGKLFVSVGWDGLLVLWGTADGNKLATVPVVDCPVNCVAFHPEGQFATLGCWNSKLICYDTLNRRKVKTLKGHRSSVRAVAYSTDGRHLASAALDGDVMLWEVKSGRSVGQFVGHSLPINQLCFTPSGKCLLTVADDWKVKVWSSNLGQPCGRQTFESKISTLCLYGKGKGGVRRTVIVGCHDGMIAVSDGQRCLSDEVAVHAARVTCVTRFQPGKYILSGSEDGTVKVSNVLPQSAGSFTHRLVVLCSLQSHDGPVSAVAASQQYVFSASHDFTAHVWLVSDVYGMKSQKPSSGGAPEALPAKQVLRDHDAPVTCCSVSADGLTFVTGGRDKNLHVYSGKRSRGVWMLSDTLETEHADWVTCLAMDDKGENVLTGSADFTMCLYDLTLGKLLKKFTGHQAAINCVQMKRGCIASGSADNTIKLWSRHGMDLTTLHGHGNRITALHLDAPDAEPQKGSSWADLVESGGGDGGGGGSAEEQTSSLDVTQVSVVSASDDKTLRTWMPFLGNELVCLTGHSDRVVSVTADKESGVVSSSLDRTVKRWTPKIPEDLSDMVSSGVEVHPDKVVGVDIAPGADYAVSADRSGNLFVWKLTACPRNPDVAMVEATIVNKISTGQRLTSLCVCLQDECSDGTFYFATGAVAMGVCVWKFSASRGTCQMIESASDTGRCTAVAAHNEHIVAVVGRTAFRVLSCTLNASLSSASLSTVFQEDLTTAPEDELPLSNEDWIKQVIALPSGILVTTAEGLLLQRSPKGYAKSNKKIKYTVQGLKRTAASLQNDGVIKIAVDEHNAPGGDLLVGFGDTVLFCGNSRKEPWQWKFSELLQVGQFSCNAPVTSHVCRPTVHGGYHTIMAANTLGQVFFLFTKSHPV
ncbi:telomerase protein component 1-like [Sycon ciliatum]|uniref:telomerase protein component 1-like n=1 Tax=Sycon ciliatum TaxID=27933 RepID=UPI0031F6ED6C